MNVDEWIASVFVFTLAGIALFLGIRSFTERGFLLNNRYLYASKKERESMNKKPYYRQSAIIFCIIATVFIAVGLSVVLHDQRFLLLEPPLFVGLIVYTVLSAVRINKNEKK